MPGRKLLDVESGIFTGLTLIRPHFVSGALNMEKLTEKETGKLRALFWVLQEAQGEFNFCLDETVKAHGKNIVVDKWIVTPDFKYLMRSK
jgi:hypothetical protein